MTSTSGTHSTSLRERGSDESYPARSFRASGVVVMARAPRGTGLRGALDRAGLPGLALNLDELVNIAALAEEPKLEDAIGSTAGSAAPSS